MSDNHLPQPEGVPQADIPNLKKKEKERKKAGAAWGSGRGAGSAFEGATGGAGEGGALIGEEAGGVARAAASATAEGAESEGGTFLGRLFTRIAQMLDGGSGIFSRAAAAFEAAEGGIFSRIAAALAEFTATTLGKMLAAAAVAMMVGVGAVIAAKMFGAGAGGAAGNGGLNLGPISSGIKVHRDGDASALDYAKNDAGVNFGKDQTKAGQAAPTAPAEKAGEAPKTDLGPGAQTPALDNGNINAMARSGLDHKFGQLSGSLGAGFGAHDVFKTQNFPAFKGKIQGLGANLAGRGAASTRARTSARAANMNMGRRFGNKMNKALGRLQQMASMNRQLYGGPSAANPEAPAQAAQDQFENQKTSGGAPPPDGGIAPGGNPGGGPSGGGVTTPPPGPGAGSCPGDGQYMDASGQCVSTDLNPGNNVTPWQNELQNAIGSIQTATMLLEIASALFLVSEIILSLGLILCSNPYTALLGAHLIILAALIMAAVGGILSIIVGVMAANISSMGDKIKDMGARNLSDHIHSIADDLKYGAATAVFAGIGGFIFASKAQDESQQLMTDMTKNLTTAAKPPSAPGGTGGGGTPNEP